MDKEKKKVKSKNMSLIYEKCNHNKYSQLIEICNDLSIESNCRNFILNYKIPIIVILLFVIVLFIYTFRNTPILIFYSLGFLLALFLFSTYNCTYKIKLNQKRLDINVNLQKTQISTKDLANIYLSKEKMRFFGFPIYNYLLNIIYLQNEKPMIITLPTVMINRKQLLKFFSNIKVQKIKDEEEEIERKNKDKKTVIKTIFFVSIIVIVVALILGAIFYNMHR